MLLKDVNLVLHYTILMLSTPEQTPNKSVFKLKKISNFTCKILMNSRYDSLLIASLLVWSAPRYQPWDYSSRQESQELEDPRSLGCWSAWGGMGLESRNGM